MSDKITRRKFLQLSGVGAGAAAVTLTGCGPAARHVVRQPYYEMPEYARLGTSTYYATTCRDCPAGCGLIMRTMEGRAIKAEGNPNHPVSQGKICSRGLTTVQELYNPDRVTGPVRRTQRGEDAVETIDWEEAVSVVAGALGNAAGTAFLLGETPAHLFDLVTDLAAALGAPEPTRYSISSILEGRATMQGASFESYGEAVVPFFDIANADVIFSFGADFLGTWVSPVSYGKAFGAFRRATASKPRGYLVSFEPRMSVTGGAADEWVPILPGTEGTMAQFLTTAVAQLRSADGGALSQAELDAVAQLTGVPAAKIQMLTERFAAASAPLVLAGGSALAHAESYRALQSLMWLNNARVGQPGGMTIPVGPPAGAGAPQLASAFNQMIDLVNRMNAGQVQALFIHGVNPLFELPPSLGFAEALANVPLVVSFSSFPDETALASDYVLPDHTGLESWGYQRYLPGTTQAVMSAMQPVVVPLYNTRATADVLLAAANQAGAGLNINDEVAYIQSKLAPFIGQGGSVRGETVEVLWANFLQAGGWWGNAFPAQESAAPAAAAQAAAATAAAPAAAPAAQAAEGESFHLVIFPTLLGDGSGANRPWLQETPDPMTTVTWNSWVEINPHTAEELGIHNDDVVRVKSAAGEIEAPAYLYPAIRPDTIAIPFGQGHTALGRFAEGRGVNPLTLVGTTTGASGNLAYGDTRVTIEKTGRRRPLARVESLKGVYGEH